MKFSNTSLEYTDPQTGAKIVPHVIEPAVGINRLFFMVLSDAYTEDKTEGRIILKLTPRLAPYIACISPLLANKEQLVEKARDLYNSLKMDYSVTWDARGNIGKRYAAQDEIGTPFCVTVDFQTLVDDTVTIRDRDTAKQDRIAISGISQFLHAKLHE
jgi:glycyl-tRNA synthetase